MSLNNEKNWQQLVAALADGVIISNYDGIILYVNEHAANLFGRTAERLIGENFLYPLAAHDTQEIEIIKPNGQVLIVEINVKLGAWEEKEAWIISLRDITDKKQKMNQLEIGSIVFNLAHEGIMVTDAYSNLIDVNQAFIDMIGYSKMEVIGQNPRIFKSNRHEAPFYQTMWSSINKAGYWKGEIWEKHKNGTVFPVYLTITAVKNQDNDIINYIGFCYDLMLLKKQEAVINRMKYYDPLTDIPNQSFLSETLAFLMNEPHSPDSNLIIVYIAVDGLNSEKNNKLLGKDKDSLIINITHRLVHCLSEDVLLARINQSDFIAVFKQIPNVMNIIPVIHNLIKELAEPYDIMSHKITPCNNIGLTSYPQGQILRPEELIRQSHLAAYEAKFAGENQYKFFDSPMELQKIKQNQLIEDIRIAMTNNQLMVYYQPKVNMKTGVILGAEALLRLNHPEKGILSPDSFLPSISNHPVFTEIGEWVLHQALNDLEKSLIAHHVFPISINISPYHLQQEHFLSNLKDILIEHPKVRSNLIELEILETEVLTNISGIKKLINECKKIGVLFALDDFGTGYSSLTYLKELPASKVKLDQSFVRDIINKPENIPILKACIQMCKLLKREVIAEGVENIEIGKLLLYLGCTHAQGYKISKPMSIEECCQWSKQWSSFPEWNISTEGQKEGRLLVNAIMGHFARIDLLKNFLILNDSSSIMEILKKCPLDIWLNRQRHILADKNKIKLMQLYEMHAVIYSVTQEIFKLQQEGKKTLAYKRMEQLESLNSDLLHQLLCLNL